MDYLIKKYILWLVWLNLSHNWEIIFLLLILKEVCSHFLQRVLGHRRFSNNIYVFLKVSRVRWNFISKLKTFFSILAFLGCNRLIYFRLSSGHESIHISMLIIHHNFYNRNREFFSGGANWSSSHNWAFYSNFHSDLGWLFQKWCFWCLSKDIFGSYFLFSQDLFPIW